MILLSFKKCNDIIVIFMCLLYMSRNINKIEYCCDEIYVVVKRVFLMIFYYFIKNIK